MAVFEIKSYRRGTEEKTVEMDVQLLDGVMDVGSSFLAWETHHPSTYQIREVRGTLPEVTFICHGHFWYDGAFVGATVDTEKFGRPAGFRYE
jgi:hypothetical protein